MSHYVTATPGYVALRRTEINILKTTLRFRILHKTINPTVSPSVNVRAQLAAATGAARHHLQLAE